MPFKVEPMSNLFRIPLAAALLFGAVSVAQAFDPWGVWVREEGGTKFDFYNCDNKLCAKVVDVDKPEERSGIGTVILRNAVKKGDNDWAGEIFNPKDGKKYTGKVKLEKTGELILSGCLLGFLCKGETWTRAPDQKLASTPGGKPTAPAFKDAPTSAK